MDTRNGKIVELLEGQPVPDHLEQFRRELSPAEHVRLKVSRNAPCPCGSGRKFKHCCLKKGR